MIRIRNIASLLIMLMLSNITSAQTKEKNITHSSGLWLGTYTKYKLTDKWFYYGEYHYRRRNQLIQDMAQIYLRFGATYRPNGNMELTGGIVTPIYWAPNQEAPNIDKRVMQYRFWEQALFVQYFDRLKLYHQIRTEQRWKRDYEKNSPFTLTHRFRYKLSTYIPLNHHQIIPGTIFASLYNEIFIQAGKSITYNHLEDNRLFIGAGYMMNESTQVQMGYMLTYRHKGSPYDYEFRHIPRISLYHSMDFSRDIKNRKNIPVLMDEF